MSEALLDELKRYVGWGPEDEAALRALHVPAAPAFGAIATVFYDTILGHEGARRALTGGESQVGHLKVTLQQWLDTLLRGPWDEAYVEARARIGRQHVRIDLPQHYMFGAMNVVRRELDAVAERTYRDDAAALGRARRAVGRILDLELAIMLHTYREDLLARQARAERLSTFGQLVGSIGHDLRNPLGVIESSVFILRGRAGGDERVVKHLDRIHDQLGVANGIITNLLDIIRNRPVTRERVEVEPLFTGALESLSRPPGVTVTAEGLAGLVAAADPGQLRQILVNLLGNALEAAAPAGAVTVRGEDGPAGIALSVEDTGPGVDPVVERRLFEPLITTKSHGIGLGLALVKRIVERHGGTVEYRRSPRGGACFTVRLPP